MSATSNVVAIPELLQQILSEVPPLNICRLQLVCKTWHKLISTSPLLQYKTWLINDYPGETVSDDDLIPELHWAMPDYDEYKSDEKRETEYNRNRYLYNITKHLNPIIVSNIMKDLPQDPRYSFDRRDARGEWYLNFRPVLLRDLVQWKEKHKDSEDCWGKLSLYRPDARKINWEVPCSDDSGIPFELEAVYEGEDNEKRIPQNQKVVEKKKGENLALTMSDLMGELDALWFRWQDSERETHYLSHDAGDCDLDQGFPEYCLESSDEEDDDGDEDGCRRERMGTRMTREEHLEQCIRNASE